MQVLIPQALPWAVANGGAAYNRSSSSSRVLFPGTFSKPSRLRCVRAASTSSVDKPCAVEMTFYEVLGVPESGTLSEIKEAHRRLARKYHPDVSPPDWMEEHTRRFIRVQEAYETLSDPMRRAVYDISKREMNRFDQEMDYYKREWRSQCLSQLSELKRRSEYKDARGRSNLSWGAQMRRQRDEPFTAWTQIFTSL